MVSEGSHEDEGRASQSGLRNVSSTTDGQHCIESCSGKDPEPEQDGGVNARHLHAYGDPDAVGLSQLSDLVTVELAGSQPASLNLSTYRLSQQNFSQDSLFNDTGLEHVLPSQPELPPPKLHVNNQTVTQAHQQLPEHEKADPVAASFPATVSDAFPHEATVFASLGPNVSSFRDPASATQKYKTRRGPMDEMRQLVRILVKIIPHSVVYLAVSEEGGGGNRISEDQIKTYLERTLGEGPRPQWGVPQGWGQYLAELFTWASGKPLTQDQAMRCAKREPGRSWESIDSELRKLGLQPSTWPLPLTRQGVDEALRNPVVQQVPCFGQKRPLDEPKPALVSKRRTVASTSSNFETLTELEIWLKIHELLFLARRRFGTTSLEQHAELATVQGDVLAQHNQLLALTSTHQLNPAATAQRVTGSTPPVQLVPVLVQGSNGQLVTVYQMQNNPAVAATTNGLSGLAVAADQPAQLQTVQLTGGSAVGHSLAGRNLDTEHHGDVHATQPSAPSRLVVHDGRSRSAFQPAITQATTAPGMQLLYTDKLPAGDGIRCNSSDGKRVDLKHTTEPSTPETEDEGVAAPDKQNAQVYKPTPVKAKPNSEHISKLAVASQEQQPHLLLPQTSMAMQHDQLRLQHSDVVACSLAGSNPSGGIGFDLSDHQGPTYLMAHSQPAEASWQQLTSMASQATLGAPVLVDPSLLNQTMLSSVQQASLLALPSQTLVNGSTLQMPQAGTPLVAIGNGQHVALQRIHPTASGVTGGLLLQAQPQHDARATQIALQQGLSGVQFQQAALGGMLSTTTPTFLVSTNPAGDPAGNRYFVAGDNNLQAMLQASSQQQIANTWASMKALLK